MKKASRAVASATVRSQWHRGVSAVHSRTAPILILKFVGDDIILRALKGLNDV